MSGAFRYKAFLSYSRDDEAVARCNEWSPHFVASLVSESAEAHDRFFATVDAPFVGDGFTRWVDGQYALDAPELGLSNWEGGRLLGRGGSGDETATDDGMTHSVEGDPGHAVDYWRRP